MFFTLLVLALNPIKIKPQSAVTYKAAAPPVYEVARADKAAGTNKATRLAT